MFITNRKRLDKHKRTLHNKLFMNVSVQII